MDDDRRSLLRSMCNSKNFALSDSQFSLLCEIGIRTGLDPFRRQLYGIEIDGRFQIVTGIDGFRAVARRNRMAGIDAPRFEYLDPQKRIPSACEVTVYRWSPHGEKESYTACGLFREYARYNKSGDLQKMWQEKSHLMLAKCVEALAMRMAFQESLGGVYERSEFGEADAVVRQSSRAPQTLADIMAADDVEHLGELEPGDDRDPTDAGAP
jgi:phage recombination protein Bet